MFRWYWEARAFPLIFFSLFGGLVWHFSTAYRNDIVADFRALKSNADQRTYASFIKTCTDQNCTYGDVVKQFIVQKKSASIDAIQNEWKLSDDDIARLSERAQNMCAYMHGRKDEGITISYASWHRARKKNDHSREILSSTITTILQENGVRNLRLEVVLNSESYYPAVYFHDIKTDAPHVPHFILELPEGFDLEAPDFQCGNLEHELMHVACGHSIFVHDLSAYLSERYKINREKVVSCESIAKLMRACEYEADLLPSLKNPDVAQNMLLALDNVTTTDEAHPPTRKRKKNGNARHAPCAVCQ